MNPLKKAIKIKIGDHLHTKKKDLKRPKLYYERNTAPASECLHTKIDT